LGGYALEKGLVSHEDLIDAQEEYVNRKCKELPSIIKFNGLNCNHVKTWRGYALEKGLVSHEDLIDAQEEYVNRKF
jgi:hypothetical protein